MNTSKFILPFLYLFSSIERNTIAQTITVTPDNFQNKGWEEEEVNLYPAIGDTPAETVVTFASSHVDISCAPQPYPPYNKGSAKLSLPKTLYPYLRRVRLRCNHHHGILLRDLYEPNSPRNFLMYSTYIVNNKNNSSPVLTLVLDNDNDDTVDYNINFSPTLQNGQNNPNDLIPDFPLVSKNTWQEWNASMGRWQLFVTDPAKPAPPSLDNNTLFTLSTYLQLFPNARVINSTTGPAAGGGIRFTVGSSADFNDFEGYIDAFKITKPGKRKPVIYDFVTRCRNNNQ